MNTKSASLVEQYFSGRQEQLTEFESFIQGEKNYRILFIHGPGGIGKTWLLRRMIAVAHEMQAPDLLVADDLIDMYSTANHSVEGVRERLIVLLERIVGQTVFQNSRRSQHELETATREGFHEEVLSSMRQNLQKNFLEDCRDLSKNKKVVVVFDTFERVQRDQVGNWLLVELLRDLPNFLFVVASREAWSGNTQVQLLGLAGFSFDEAQEYFRNREQSTAEREMLDVIREKASGHPLQIALAIEFLSGNLLRDVNELRVLEIEEFERALIAPLRGIGQGLFGSPEFDEAVYQTILFMAHFNRRFHVELLRLFVGQGAVDLHGLQPEEVLAKLEQEYFFVKTRPDGYIQLHDEMECLVNKHLWPEMDPRGDLRRELAHIACRWYDELIVRANENKAALEDLKAEQLVYWLDVDLDKAYDLLQSYGYNSFVLNNLLVVEIKPENVNALPDKYRYRFAADLGDRARRVYLYQRGQEYWRIAVDVAQQDGNPDQTIDALLGLHNCTYMLDLKQSLNILKKDALPLCDRSETKSARVSYEIGFTYSHLQDIPHAIEWYEKAQKAAQDVELMATILNDMGYAYVFLGEYKRAGRYAKRALELRQDRVKHLENLLSDKETSIVSGEKVSLERDLSDVRRLIGLSFNTLGEIKRFDGDLSAATGAYSEALEIFRMKDVNDYLWQAKALHSRGEAHRRIAETLYGQGRVKASKDFEKRAQEDLDNSLLLCNQYGFNEKHTANRRMGRLFHDQAKHTSNLKECLELLGKARGYFERGLQAAIDDKNALEELENLTELAFLVDDRLEAQKQLSSVHSLSQIQLQEGEKDIERLRDSVKRHEKSALHGIFQVSVFAHLLKLEEGAFHFVQDHFDDALENYLEGYAGLASTSGYGVARYRQHLGHLFVQLKKIDDPVIVRKWGEVFIKKWKETKVKPVEPEQPEQTLAQLHPELVEEMQIYLDTAFVSQDQSR